MFREHIENIPARKADSHKGDFGRVLVLAGSRGMTGAAYMSCQGALLSGSGLVINAIPVSLNDIMAVKFIEVMTLSLPGTIHNSLSLLAKDAIVEFSKKCDVVAIGPGLGSADETHVLVRVLLEEIEKPIVLDADGINALGGDIDILKSRKHRTVITPHPGEMARLLGRKTKDVQAKRTETARSVAEITGSTVCLKGHRTVVASPDGDIYVNETGNSGMASGGTGDVLTGMVASFIGQGVEDFSAAVSAVYLHGLAGDIAAEKKSQFSMTASDILACLPEAFRKSGL